ncbi:hypothetical protein ACRS6Y_05205 [Bacillus cytotoxicus]|uniref:hypothetical protein n=1 Tax=Bacillus cereus group TaxID=86661 RepID=UPI00065F9CEA|nr:MULTISPECIES: hypothetical protein [Bacillus cereus group]AWC31743.1 hypothetical protein CG482_004465 [Bacillus cytotoxicus]AWC35780.1 hypothetical protein CG481_004465 [Bacillus cytotoxicus]AWC60018.1 hypothetical protein CG474_004535 [Bacillus cytotoxicus]KMT50243.1 hypothetical protein TU51_04305 [Bacillus cytotoxicus]QTR71878.1 hypothetical protein JC775_04595 [Bacillus cytotoxicus]
MEIKLLKKGYKNNEQFYKDFLDDQIKYKDEYFLGDSVYIDEAPDFPIYLAQRSVAERKKLFLEAFDVLSRSYLHTDRDLHFDEVFWHSLLTTMKRDYLLETYPQIADDIKYFNNIVLKDFNWESYIYKCVLGVQYINDAVSDEKERIRYYELLVDNLDMYNYIIKYEIFRNDRFLLNILDIIDELNVSKVMKSKITGRDYLGKDERVGRRVIFEFNKSYPVVMSPMLEKDELKEYFLLYLSYYYDDMSLLEEPVGI